VAAALPAGRPHTVTLNKSQVTVPARSEATVRVTLAVPSATAGDSSAFNDVAGQVTFTPVAGANHGVALRVPYYLVPQATSKIETKIDARQLGNTGSAVATVTNKNGAVTGAADWYAWGLSDRRDRGLGSNDVRAIGAQSFPGLVVFGIGTERRWSNAATNEFDILVDVNLDGVDDYAVVAADVGALTTGSADGRTGAFVFDLRTGAGSIQFLADAPHNSTTMAVPALVSQLCAAGSPCLSAANPRFRYHAVSFDLVNTTTDEVDGVAAFNAFTPAISNGMFDVVAPNATATETVEVDAAEFALTPALGLMILSHDNKSNDEAQLVSVRVS
jgi:minor extracellular serine protease Vpr